MIGEPLLLSCLTNLKGLLFLWIYQPGADFGILLLVVQVISALQSAGSQMKQPLTNLFTDVYDTIPRNLIQQEKELRSTVGRHHEDYPSDVPLYWYLKRWSLKDIRCWYALRLWIHTLDTIQQVRSFWVLPPQWPICLICTSVHSVLVI